MKQHKYLIPITGLFTATLLISNTLESKVVLIGPLEMTAGTIIFPLAYLFNDMLTEVYGYAASRTVIWTGFAALLLMTLFYQLAVMLPPAPVWDRQEGYAATLGAVPRIALASMVAYLLGEFVNSYVVAKMKVATQGRRMGLRFVASSMAGQSVDTAIFMAVAFAGVFNMRDLLSIGLTVCAAKIVWEIAALPLTLFVVKRLKIAENQDHYDIDTSFNPFHKSIKA